MNRHLYFGLLALGSALPGCGSGGGSGGDIAPPPPVVNVSPGGFWYGFNSIGGEVFAIVTETGRFHFLTVPDFSQGTGTLSVSNSNNLNGTFQLVTQLGYVFEDGTTLANCTFSGTVAERQTVNASIECTTTAGLMQQSTAALDYDVAYDRDSSLATIAGNYQGFSAVLNVAGDGTIFSQDPVTGCVVNGLVSVLNSNFNAYDLNFTYDSCTGFEAILNGSNFTGIAALDNSEDPEVLIATATGSVGGVLISFVEVLDRI